MSGRLPMAALLPFVRWHFLNPSRLLSNLASWAVFSGSGAHILFVPQGHGMTGKQVAFGNDR
jgi:hypothetical protein